MSKFERHFYFRVGNKEGLVHKRRKPEDERVVELHLSEKGKHALNEHTGLDVKKLDKCLTEMSYEERELISQAFDLLAKRLE